ncbi:MAG TPA: type II toxin-antitoxin system VapC family toxin [Candidatus Limnocylindria bacterium]|nr:type II toxin-antitoxin system VapC family toxin [Candidatus Limnocylindria bacterium]
MAGGGPSPPEGQGHRRRRADPRGETRGGLGGLIVLDASVAVDRVTAGMTRAAVDDLLTDEVAVPAHFDAEALAGIRRALRRRLIDRDRAELSLLMVARLPAGRRPLTPMLAEAFALRDRFSPGDAFYAVLARRLGARLLTADASLARACAGYVEAVLVRSSRARSNSWMR